MWSGTTRTPVYAGPGDQIYPTTDGSLVVWQDDRNGNWDLYSYDLATGKVEQLTFDPSNQTRPHLQDGVLVWQDDRDGDWDIRALDLATGRRWRSSPVNSQTDPRTGSDKIVWVDDRKGDKDIYMYEIYRELGSDRLNWGAGFLPRVRASTTPSNTVFIDGDKGTGSKVYLIGPHL